MDNKPTHAWMFVKGKQAAVVHMGAWSHSEYEVMKIKKTWNHIRPQGQKYPTSAVGSSGEGLHNKPSRQPNALLHLRSCIMTQIDSRSVILKHKQICRLSLPGILFYHQTKSSKVEFTPKWDSTVWTTGQHHIRWEVVLGDQGAHYGVSVCGLSAYLGGIIYRSLTGMTNHKTED